MTLSDNFRLRRRHQKSRNGCVRCKMQRKKCDERNPSCTRCATYGYPCSLNAAIRNEIDSDRSRREDLKLDYDSLRSVATSTNLSPVEVSLLRSFVLDTSRAVAYDAEELFVLQVGFPMLARRNRALTASMLALSTAWQCYRLTTKSMLGMKDVHTLGGLLVAADRYYDASLYETRSAMNMTVCYDHVLANATLLVLYGLASYSLRIRLEGMTEGRDSKRLQNCTRMPCQWMRLIRSTCMVYNNLCGEPTIHVLNTNQMSETPVFFPKSGNATLISESGPSERTELLFLPIVVATYQAAFERLQVRVEALEASTVSKLESREASADNHQLTLDDCVAALEILTTISSELFDAERTRKGAASRDTPGRISSSENLASQLRPWLRAYVARVTSVQPSKPLRRTITNFLNRIPIAYFNFIQKTLEDIPLEWKGAEEMTCSNYPSSQTALEQMALDIFAHWLVLVMLLDGVWWIGNVGKWELTRLIMFMEDQGCAVCQERGWWPRGMLNIQEEIAKQ